MITCPRATWAPLKVIDRASYEERFATNDELMKLMGYQTGALKTGTSDQDMEKMMGNAFHYQLIRALVVKEQNDAAQVYQSTKVKRTYGPFKHASDEENRLHAMTDEQLDAYTTGNLKDYKEMELKLFPKPSASSYQILRQMRFFAPQGRFEATSRAKTHKAGTIQ